MSNFIEWSDELSVGIEEIDAQHQVLVGLVNEMHDAIQHRHGSSVVIGILKRLADYTRIHFAVEESLMRILAYPGYDGHKEEHEKLLEHVKELQEKVDSGRTAIGFELMHFLKIWLTKHIMESDKKYAPYLIEAGARTRHEKKSWATKLWDHLHH